MCSPKRHGLLLTVLLLLLFFASHIRGDVNPTHHPVLPSSSPNATSGLSPQRLVQELAQVCHTHAGSVPAWLVHTCSQATEESMTVGPTMLQSRHHLPTPAGDLNTSRRRDGESHKLRTQVGQLNTSRRRDAITSCNISRALSHECLDHTCTLSSPPPSNDVDSNDVDAVVNNCSQSRRFLPYSCANATMGCKFELDFSLSTNSTLLTSLLERLPIVTLWLPKGFAPDNLPALLASGGARSLLNLHAAHMAVAHNGLPTNMLANVPALQVLNMSWSSISVLPAELFANLTNLVDCDLSHNNLQWLSSTTFANNTALQSIDLSYNSLTSLPPTLFQSNTELQSIKLGENNLTSLDGNTFTNNTALTLLELTWNALTTLDPNTFLNNINMEILLMDFNHLCQLAATHFHSLTSLQTLVANDNQLGNFPPDAFALQTQLQTLILDNNNLNQLPNLTTNNALKFLSVSHNHITTIDALGSKPNLVTLGLAYNDLCSIPTGLFGTAAALADVALDHNQLQSLPPELTNTSSLRSLSAANNSLQGEITINGVKLWSLLLANNQLTSVTFANVSAQIVSLSHNPTLSNINVVAPLDDIPILDLSNTSVKYDESFCRTFGSKQLFAKDMIDTSWSNNVGDLLNRCLSTIEVLAITDVPLSVAAPLQNNWYLMTSSESISGKNLSYKSADGKRLLPLEPLAHLLLGPGNAVQCSYNITNNMLYTTNSSIVPIFTLPVATYTCSCSIGYAEKDGSCHFVQPKKQSFFETDAGKAFKWFLIVLASSSVVILGAWLLRRRFKSLRNNLELHQWLLEDAQVEMAQLRKAWEIDANEVRLEKRIDDDSPGAFGAVWEADMSGMRVAVKVLRAELMELDESTADEFSKEADFLMRARHPNLVRFFGVGHLTDGAPFLVLELVARGSLSSLLHSEYRREDMPETVRLRLLLDVACGMAYIHSLNALHRDLKTGNVLVTEEYRGKIADFGSMAQLLRKYTRKDVETTSHVGGPTIRTDLMNSLSTGVGTPMYMSPEVLSGEINTPADDVWSFGVVVWETVAGQRPDLLGQQGNVKNGPVMHQLLQCLRSNVRLRMDEGFWPDWARSTARDCWAPNPALRPTFETLISRLEEHSRLLSFLGHLPESTL